MFIDTNKWLQNFPKKFYMAKLNKIPARPHRLAESIPRLLESLKLPSLDRSPSGRRRSGLNELENG